MTIHLHRGLTASQIIPCTLNEMLPCHQTCYKAVFYIKNRLTNKKIYFIGTDVSTMQFRINLIQVEIVQNINDQDLENGKIYFSDRDLGHWDFTIFNQRCDVDGIDPNSFVNILEEGYLKLHK